MNNGVHALESVLSSCVNSLRSTVYLYSLESLLLSALFILERAQTNLGLTCTLSYSGNLPVCWELVQIKCVSLCFELSSSQGGNSPEYVVFGGVLRGQISVHLKSSRV